MVVVVGRVCGCWLGVWVCGAFVLCCSGVRVSWRRVGRGSCCCAVLAWVCVRGFGWVQKECRVVWWLLGRGG